jgi:hypothetical protein
LALPATTATLTVGAGGVGGLAGNSTTFSAGNVTIAALGGGFGGGGNGGCGGGSIYLSATVGVGSQGFNGGVSQTTDTTPYGAAGGGGLGGAGFSLPNGGGLPYGKGGPGIVYNGVAYGGGGGGFTYAATQKIEGGSGGGGEGGYDGVGTTGYGSDGGPNTGGGGGGTNSPTVWTNGGSGVFICSFFTPTSIAGCTVWLDANDVNGTGTNATDGTALVKWTNKSLGGTHATGVGGPVLTYRAMNGQPGIALNGTNQWFTGSTNNTGTTDTTVFAVATMNGAGTNRRILGLHNGSSPDSAAIGNMVALLQNGSAIAVTSYRNQAWVGTSGVSGTVTLNTPFMASTIASSSGISTRINGGVTATSTTTGTFSYNLYGIGYEGVNNVLSDRWNGFISEVLIFKASALSDYNRLRVETYLANKYSISDYFYVPPFTIGANATLDTDYFTVVSGGKTYYRFVATGKTMTITLASSKVVDLCLIGGGGGGAAQAGGGGGAGGLQQSTGITLAAGTYSITIGLGGAGGSTSPMTYGRRGGNSTFSNMTANGGGGSGGYQNIAVEQNGGCGAGAGYESQPGTGNQGGGGGTYNFPNSTGGGGVASGSSGIGKGTGGNVGGAGGDGITYNFGGTNLQIGGGGGGGGFTSTRGLGSFNGGNGSGTNISPATAGANGSGAGGGGGGWGTGVVLGGGNGGSGVFFIVA